MKKAALEKIVNVAVQAALAAVKGITQEDLDSLDAKLPLAENIKYESGRNKKPVYKAKEVNLRLRKWFAVYQLEAGQSVFYPTPRGVNKELFRQRVMGAAKNAATHLPDSCRDSAVYKSRVTEENGLEGIRVYRLV